MRPWPASETQWFPESPTDDAADREWPAATEPEFREATEHEAGFGNAPPADSRERARWIQRSLNHLLGINLTADGILGPATRGAVRQFQQRHGLTPDGVVGPATEGAIRRALAGAGSGTGTPAGSPGPCFRLSRFDFDQAQLKASHAAVLRQAAQEILARSRTSRGAVDVRITGHTDAAGSEPYNLGLGARRAEAAKRGLIDRLNRLQPGSASRVSIRTESRGEAEPVSPVASENRRADICLPRRSSPPSPRPSCRSRLRLHLKVLSAPRLPISTMIRSMRQVFGPAGLEVTVGSVERLRVPALEELDIRCPTNPATTCCPFPCPTALLNPEHLTLFTHRRGAGRGDIVVYFVRATVPSSRGCCAHPVGLPGVVVAAVASPWTLAHEVAHVLGLPHVSDTDRLMFRNTGSITNPPPDLTPAEIQTLHRSPLALPC